MNEASTRPSPPTRPHEWKRPTGVVDDPWAWLADRDDPATIAYLEAENAYADQFFAEPTRADLVETIYDEIKSRVQETDLSVPVHHGGWWYVTRTIEGQAYPVFCRSRDPECPTRRTPYPRLQRRGRGPRVLRRPRRRTVTRPHAARLVERRRRRRALHAAGPRPRHRRGRRRDHRHLVVGRRRLVGRNDWLFYARPDDQMRPYQIWRHRLGHAARRRRPRPHRGRRTLLPRRRRDAQRAVDRHLARRRRRAASPSSSAPTTRKATPRLVRARTPDVEYGIDDWGDRFVVLTNLDAPDFRLMTAPHDDPGAWSDLVAHEAGRRLTDAEPFADHLVVHEWKDAQPRVRVLRRDGTAEVLDFGDEPHDLALGANPEWDDDTLRLSYQSLTAPPSVFDHDLATGERVLRKQTPTPGVDLDRVRRSAHLGDGHRRRRRSRSTSSATSTPRSTAPRRAWSTATAPTSPRWRRGSASPGCRCSTAASCGRSSIPAAAASSAGRGTSTASC